MASIYNYTLKKMEDYLTALGEKPYRAKQILQWVYRYKVQSFEQMTNIKKDLIAKISQDLQFDELKLVTQQESVDGTCKFLFELADKNLIETVLMQHDYGLSLCVTTQVGCNMNCAFCASGINKKLRNLAVFELVLQVLMVEKIRNIKITHIVIMGIGEPFDNYENVLSFMEIVNFPLGLEIGARHITVSTCGLVPKIKEYADFPLQVNLAISLHAPNDDIRQAIMPIAKVYSLAQLKEAIKYYIAKTNRRVTVEYILLKDLNDTISCADELANYLRGLNVYVNLIPYNEVLEKPYKRSTPEAMHNFYDRLKKRGINVTLRREQGFDIAAACGQLRSKHLK